MEIKKHSWNFIARETRKCIFCNVNFECRIDSQKNKCLTHARNKDEKWKESIRKSWQETKDKRQKSIYDSMQILKKKGTMNKSEEFRRKISEANKRGDCGWDIYNKKVQQGLVKPSMLGKKMSEVVKQKNRERRLQQIFPVKDTSIEVLMKLRLEKLSLIKDFEQHKPIFKRWQADFVSEKYKIIIECDGDYWHANPVKFDRNNLRFLQQKKVKRDEEINNFIINNTDYMLLRFWESQINTDIEGIGNFILNMCNRGEINEEI